MTLRTLRAAAALAMSEAPTFSCVSWNIHRARGSDGLVDPRRIEAVIAQEIAPCAPLILALQEADADAPSHKGLLDIPAISASTGLHWSHGEAEQRWSSQSHGFLGVVLFLAPQITVRHTTLIDLPGHCARGAVAVESNFAGMPLRIIATHLSLSQILRIAQMRTIGQFVQRRPAMPTLLLGDFNEWRPWGGLALSRRVTGLTLRGPVRATFPAAAPFLPLDRVLTDASGAHITTEVLNSPAIRAASDHRPLAAHVTLAAAAATFARKRHPS